MVITHFDPINHCRRLARDSERIIGAADSKNNYGIGKALRLYQTRNRIHELKNTFHIQDVIVTGLLTFHFYPRYCLPRPSWALVLKQVYKEKPKASDAWKNSIFRQFAYMNSAMH
jgi:hypothetical protein